MTLHEMKQNSIENPRNETAIVSSPTATKSSRPSVQKMLAAVAAMHAAEVVAEKLDWAPSGQEHPVREGA